MPTPALSTTYILAVVTSVVALFLTQNIIDNKTAQLVTGLASVFIPLALALANTLFHAHTQAALINAASRAPQAPVQPRSR